MSSVVSSLARARARADWSNRGSAADSDASARRAAPRGGSVPDPRGHRRVQHPLVGERPAAWRATSVAMQLARLLRVARGERVDDGSEASPCRRSAAGSRPRSLGRSIALGRQHDPSPCASRRSVSRTTRGSRGCASRDIGRRRALRHDLPPARRRRAGYGRARHRRDSSASSCAHSTSHLNRSAASTASCVARRRACSLDIVEREIDVPRRLRRPRRRNRPASPR